MVVSYHEIEVNTKGEVDMVDITTDIIQCIKKSGVNEGIVNICNPGSTGSLTTIEYEPGLQKDFPRFFERIAPKQIKYEHHKTWNDDNGHSHVRASLMGPSITMPVHKGKLVHGTWQQIVFVEFDTTPRKRHIIISIIGK